MGGIRNICDITAKREIFRCGYKCSICRWSLLEEAVKILPDEGKKEFLDNFVENLINGNVVHNGLDIHHIVEVKNGGSKQYDNLIALCPNCHRLVHKGIYSKEFLLQVKSIDDYNDDRINISDLPF